MTPRKEKTRENGFVLVVVLCMIILLAGVLFGFNAKSYKTLKNMDDFKESQKAIYCARAGLNVAIGIIVNADDANTGQMLPILDSKESVFDIADGTCSLSIIQESGKLNVNLLCNDSNDLDRSRTEQLLNLIDQLNRGNNGYENISYSIVPSIIDWIDNDDQVTYLPFIKHQNTGAESSYYEQLAVPYVCRNKPLDTIEELLLVKDVTNEVFNKMRDYLTVYGDGKININYASKQVLESLSKNVDTALAQMIIARRQFKLFDSIAELREITGMTDDIYHAIKKTVVAGGENQYYRVISNANVGQRYSKVVAVLRKNAETKIVEIVLYKEY